MVSSAPSSINQYPLSGPCTGSAEMRPGPDARWPVPMEGCEITAGCHSGCTQLGVSEMMKSSQYGDTTGKIQCLTLQFCVVAAPRPLLANDTLIFPALAGSTAHRGSDQRIHRTNLKHHGLTLCCAVLEIGCACADIEEGILVSTCGMLVARHGQRRKTGLGRRVEGQDETLLLICYLAGRRCSTVSACYGAWKGRDRGEGAGKGKGDEGRGELQMMGTRGNATCATPFFSSPLWLSSSRPSSPVGGAAVADSTPHSRGLGLMYLRGTRDQGQGVIDYTAREVLPRRGFAARGKERERCARIGDDLWEGVASSSRPLPFAPTLAATLSNFPVPIRSPLSYLISSRAPISSANPRRTLLCPISSRPKTPTFIATGCGFRDEFALGIGSLDAER
ncbi:hypothetical protein B0H19DRAFT_1067974 [Mycena capillaripes]|nr:hypothetical protein B0H19DRAFT_1067974 [Mycena capillaripes]